MLSPDGLNITFKDNCATMTLKLGVGEARNNLKQKKVFKNTFKSRTLNLIEKKEEKNQQIVDILIVDDYEINLQMLQRQIKTLAVSCKCLVGHDKYAIHVARSGIQAINSVLAREKEGGGYKLVIMDCQMPEMDGWEATLAIIDLYAKKKIHILPYIIAYSTFDSSKDIEKCSKSGMDGYISKPCYPEELCMAIINWLSKPIQKQQT